MTPFLLYGLAAIALFCLALWAALVSAHVVRRILALNVMGTAVFLLLASVARRNTLEIADPVPHAMVLTGIVVAVSTTAFALALARRLHAEGGHVSVPEDEAE